MDELSFTLTKIHELQVPITIIGCGSNILVKDGGIRGAVVSVRHMTQIMDCNDNVLCIGSGLYVKDASEFAWENGLSGLGICHWYSRYTWWCCIYECRCL